MSKYDDVVSSNFVLYMLTFPDIFRRNSKKAPCIMWEHLTSSIFAAASREAVGLATFLPAPASKVWRAPGSNTARSGKDNRVHVERVLNFEVFVCKMCLRGEKRIEPWNLCLPVEENLLSKKLLQQGRPHQRDRQPGCRWCFRTSLALPGTY